MTTRAVRGERLDDLSDASVGDRDAAFPLPHWRDDEFHHGGLKPGCAPSPPKGLKPRDTYIPDLSLKAIQVKARDFR